MAFIISILIFASPAVQVRNTIEGRVVSPERRGVDNIRVILQNDVYSQIGMTYTDGSGRFSFRGLASGTYIIQVEPAGTDYERQSQTVEANPLNVRRGSSGRSSGGEIFRVDFVLKLPAARTKTDAAVGTIFAQDVPEQAKQEFLKGLKSLDKDDFDSAAASLNRALEIFPDYYAALDLLGTKYVERREYQTALPLLARAVEVNKNGWHAFYSLGITLAETNRRAEGIIALRRAYELNPESVNTQMRLGLELAKEDQSRDEAIAILKKAASAAKNSYPEVYLALAQLQSKNRQYAEAADSLEAYLKAVPQAEQQAEKRAQIKKLIEQLRQKASAQAR